MSVVVWITEGTWAACADAARGLAPLDAEVVLLHVTGTEVPGVAHAAFAGLLGRGHPRGRHTADGWGSDPGDRLEDLAAASARHLLDAAAHRLGRPCVSLERTDRTEHEVVAAASGAELLILARR